MLWPVEWGVYYIVLEPRILFILWKTVKIFSMNFRTNSGWYQILLHVWSNNFKYMVSGGGCIQMLLKGRFVLSAAEFTLKNQTHTIFITNLAVKRKRTSWYFPGHCQKKLLQERDLILSYFRTNLNQIKRRKIITGNKGIIKVTAVKPVINLFQNKWKATKK